MSLRAGKTLKNLLAVSLVSSTLYGGHDQRPEQSTVLAKPVASFEARGITMPDALLKFAKAEGLPLGLESIDLDAFQNPITLTLIAVKVADVLDAIMASNKHYTWAYQDGLVIVRRLDTPAGVKNLLNQVLPEFSTPRSTLQEASLLLYMSLSRLLHPGPWGIAGDYNPGLTENFVGPFTMRNVTVKQALDRLVAEKGRAAWIVQVPPQFMDQLPSSGLWSLVEYDDPALQYAGENLRQNLLPYSRPDKDAPNKHN